MVRLSRVCFVHELTLPNGSMGRTLDEDSHNVNIVREGDTLVVTGKFPENASRGFDTDVEIHYNWAVVAYALPKREAKPVKK